MPWESHPVHGWEEVKTGLLGLYFTPGESVLIATFGVTSLVLLFGETAPKSYGVEHSQNWSLRVARPLRVVQLVLYPLVELFDLLTRVIDSLMGSQGDFETAYITRSEVRDVITAGQRAGVFTDEEHQMLQRLLRFRNRIVKETMVPRLDIVAVEAATDLQSAIDICLDRGFNHLPVYEESLDTVVGIVHVRDLVRANSSTDDVSLRSLAMDPFVVPETKEVDELLTELRTERQRMAIVVDEFGTTAGIVTIEDIVEEIVGEILTETESPPIRRLDDETVLVRGELNIHEANETLGLELPESGEFESIAGLLMDRTGRLVEEGEAVTYGDIRLVAETIDRNRILAVRIDLSDAVGPASESPDEP